jgi:hypothetical protein
MNPLMFKVAIAGSFLVVPASKSWQIDKVFFSTDNGYTIQINKNILKPVYHAGDTIRLPYYVAEMELAGKVNPAQYTLYITETE